MKLSERIAAGEAMGLRLRGFYVAPDVYQRIAAETPRAEAETLGRLMGNVTGSFNGSLALQQNAHLPPGCVAPMWEQEAPRLGWRLNGEAAQAPRATPGDAP